MDQTELKRQTQKFAVEVIKFSQNLPANNSSVKVLSNQLLRSATSIGANYISACKGKSTADFINKITISEEEADESIYWFELMEESGLFPPSSFTSLKIEATELTAIFTAIGKTAKANQKITNTKK